MGHEQTGAIAMIRMVWHGNRRKTATLLMLMATATLSLAAAARESMDSNDAAVWTLADILTPQNILSLLVLVFHFGVLRQEMRGMQERIHQLEESQKDFARKDVLDAKLDSILRLCSAKHEKLDRELHP